jgi:hypothetical protein
MRTRETVLLGLLLALAPAALAQEQDPSLNESAFDTSPPPSDESYLDEGTPEGQSGEASATSEPDPTLGEGDFDMSAPSADTSYLGDDAGSDAAAATDAGRSAVPLPGVAAALGALAVAALGLRRRA